MEKPLLVVQQLSSARRGGCQLEECSFTVAEGSVTALIGPAGAGKSAVIDAISGFLPSAGGRVIFRGVDVSGLPPHRRFHKGMARTFQVPRIDPSMTVLDHLLLAVPGHLGEQPWNNWFRYREVQRQEAEERRRAMDVLAFVDLWHLREEKAGNLSWGQRKLLDLGRALMAEPVLLMLDEPAQGLNPALRYKLYDRLTQLRREGTVTVLIAQSGVEGILQLCDRAVVLSSGRTVREGPPGAVLPPPAVGRLGEVNDADGAMEC